MASIIYSPKDIFEQEFKISMRGFDRAEVDEFLDNVINDYELFLAELETLRSENAKLKTEVADLKTALAEKEDQLAKPASEEAVKSEAVKVGVGTPVTPAYVAPQPVQKPLPAVDEPIAPPFSEEPFADQPRMSMAATNFDILKRISRLEKEVFGKKIVE